MQHWKQSRSARGLDRLPEIDEFARTLLEEAKRFLEKVSDTTNLDAISAYLHSALMLAFCSLEAHVNSIAEEIALRPDLSTHERGLLLEREVRLDQGEFVLTKAVRMVRLEDRIMFLHLKCAGSMDRSKGYWSELGMAIKMRNHLTHPKDAVSTTEAATQRAIAAIIEAIDDLYHAVYGKPFPAAGRGLQSKLNF